MEAQLDAERLRAGRKRNAADGARSWVIRPISAGTGVVGSGRAEATGLPIDGRQRISSTWMPSRYPPTGELGDAGRNTIPGPWTWSLNTAFGRYFTIGGEGSRKRLELRLETTNTLNHVNITNVNTVVGSTLYGLADHGGRHANRRHKHPVPFLGMTACTIPTYSLRILCAALAGACLRRRTSRAHLQDQHQPGHHQRGRKR